jgi:DNA-binding CsgD family transcriptional regulator
VAIASDQLVGRSAELAFLRHRLAAARSGSGRLVLVCGPAGIGKTRLVEELVAESGGVPIGWGAALADSGMPPLWPWTRALRSFPRPSTALAAVLTGDTQGECGSAEDAAAATFAADTAVMDTLEEEAAAGMVLVLDDLQWADRATYRLLERLAAEIRRLSLLVVATHRDPEYPALDGLLGYAGTEVLRLRPLSSDESEALLVAALDHADRAAVQMAAARSGGSPLYLRTLAQVAADQLRGLAPWTETTEAPEFRHLVSAAMRGAGPQARVVVEAASVLGAEAPSWLVAQLLGVNSAEEVMEWLQPAVPAGLVETRPAAPNDICFAHALVREAAYASLPAQRRTELHRRAAELLEGLAIGHDEQAGAVARHWEQAGQPDRAAECAVRAADVARTAGAYDEAAKYLSLALRSVDPGIDSAADIGLDRAELLLDLARSQYLGGRLEESLASCERAADEGERTGRADIIGRAAIIIQGVGHRSTNQHIMQLCKRCLELLDPDTAMDLRARVEAQLACALFEIGEPDEGWLTAALEHAAASGDPNAELDAIRARAAATFLPAFNRELLELARRSIELAEPTGRPLARLWGHIWLSDSAIYQGNIAGARQELGEIKTLADRTGLPLARWHWLRRKASLAALTGDFAGCRRFAAEAESVAASWHDESVHSTHLGLMVCLALLRGDAGDLPSGWMDLIPDVADLPPVGQAMVSAGLALVGRRDESMAIFRPLARAAGQFKGLNLGALQHLTDVGPMLGDAVSCRVLRTVISESFAGTVAMGVGTVFYKGSLARWLGELDVVCGDYDDAIAHLREGLVIDANLGAQPYVARGRLALARAFHAKGDLARSIELARAAVADARRLDMPGVLGDAESLLEEAAAATRLTDPLTAREREIARLVAKGLSNKEVASKLVLSERTVESHVRSILTKTSLRSRTELTRWILQTHDR